MKEIHFDTLLRVLKQTDWSKTLIYQQFLTHGRWKHIDNSIYSEIELKYLTSTLTNMLKKNEKQREEFTQNEGPAILEKHWTKTLFTL